MFNKILLNRRGALFIIGLLKNSFDSITKKLMLLMVLFLFIQNVSFSQEGKENLTEINSQKVDVEWERPFNFFAAAGASYLFGNHYSVAVSPIDNTIQFDKTFPIITRFSLGLVWNPIPEEEDVKTFLDKRRRDQYYKVARKHLAVALLINVFQMSYSNEFNSSSPIDVGFGIGYRSSNFLILGTVELTPIRTPRTYFENQFRDRNMPLVLSGSTEPIRTISVDDNALFMNRIFPSLGIKMAYSFTKQK
ncbi:hypothetical protein [Anditalea andensis]|uniref:Uncharacterized protein n=1 Tax=Anditalea andensis TaxID=1048983 RepID=A0A074KTL1_9BACT|nr:hypothetical protein [Anditalea andensis]KEO72234.1 hypothetical protein EL17_18715 [Anditalea andensis]